MVKPKVSVIMPVYNTEMYVREAIESVLNQTLADWELILVNDGSTDGSLNILEHYTNLDSRIVLVNQSNKGLSGARNSGLSIARGDYVYFLDSDDYIKQETLLLCYESCSSNSLDVVFFDAETLFDGEHLGSHSLSYVREHTKPHEILEGREMLMKLLGVDEYLASACLLFISRELILANSLTFYEGIVHEDELFTTQVFCRSNNVMYLPCQLFVRRLRADSIMTTPVKKRNIDCYFIVANELNRLGDEVPKYRKSLDLYLTKLLNAVVWKAHVLPLKERCSILWLSIRDWFTFVSVKSLVVLSIKKYLPK